MSSNSKKEREILKKMQQEIEKKQQALEKQQEEDRLHEIWKKQKDTIQLGQNSVMCELSKYYNDEGIAAINFDCRHKESCMRDSINFVTPREATVGTRYDKYILPRVLFIAADPANSWPGPQPIKRTLAYMQHIHETGCLPGPLGDSPVWQRTHEFAYKTLKGIATKSGVTLTNPDDKFKHSDHICKYFAFTNSAKCKFNSEIRTQGPPLLFENCREYMIEEVRILRPDIIFTWGYPARDAIQGIPYTDKVTNPNNPKYGYDVLNLNDREVLKFTLPQPIRVDEFYKQEREGVFEWYFAEAQKFLQSWKQSDAGRLEFWNEIHQEKEDLMIKKQRSHEKVTAMFNRHPKFAAMLEKKAAERELEKKEK